MNDVLAPGHSIAVERGDVSISTPTDETWTPSSYPMRRGRFGAQTIAFDSWWTRTLRPCGASFAGLGWPLIPWTMTQQVFLIAARKLGAIESGRERAIPLRHGARGRGQCTACTGPKPEVLDEEVMAAQVDPSPDAEAVLDARQKRALLERALEGMQDQLRAVFVLYVLEGGTVPEIAELLGIPPGTVASRLRRAREAFHRIAKRLKAGAHGGNSP